MTRNTCLVAAYQNLQFVRFIVQDSQVQYFKHRPENRFSPTFELHLKVPDQVVREHVG